MRAEAATERVRLWQAQVFRTQEHEAREAAAADARAWVAEVFSPPVASDVDDVDEATRQGIQDEANRKRAVAMDGTPYAPKGEKRKPEKVVVHNGQQPSKEPRAKERHAKAASAGVNATAIARAETLVKKDRELALRVAQGECKPADAIS